MNISVREKIEALPLPQRFQTKLLISVDFLLSYGIPGLEEIILFGSCARNQLRVTSDIDLLVITEAPIERMIRGDIASELEEAIEGVSADVIFYTKEQFQDSSRLFTEQVKKEGIHLYSRESQV